MYDPGRQAHEPSKSKWWQGEGLDQEASLAWGKKRFVGRWTHVKHEKAPGPSHTPKLIYVPREQRNTLSCGWLAHDLHSRMMHSLVFPMGHVALASRRKPLLLNCQLGDAFARALMQACRPSSRVAPTAVRLAPHVASRKEPEMQPGTS